MLGRVGVLVVVAAAGCGSQSGGGNADAPIGDSRVSDAGLWQRCHGVEREFESFVEANNDCLSDSDCKVVFGNHDCNCIPALGQGCGTGVNVSADPQRLAVFAEQQDSCRSCAYLPCSCDCDTSAAYCGADGRCKVRTQSCLAYPSDGGGDAPPDAAPGDGPADAAAD